MNPSDFGAKDAAKILRWWLDAGVEFGVDETPRDRFAKSDRAELHAAEAPPSPPLDSPPTMSRESSAVAHVSGDIAPPDAALAAARELAASAADLAALRSIMGEFEGCGLKRTATQLVFADGAPGAPVMLVGEAPGGDEDRLGRPFVGRAGQLLDRMLNAVGLDRSRVYIANVVPWRPPGNRTPTLQETQICLPFIRRQIELAKPKILVCLGSSSAQTLLGLKSGITRARGSWFSYRCENGQEIRAFAMLHPAYLLRQPSQKRLAWSDLRALASELKILERG